MVHLAAHLFGADTLQTQAAAAATNHGFRLYWRSPLLTRQKDSNANESSYTSEVEAAPGLVFIDVMFEFACQEEDTTTVPHNESNAKDDGGTADERMIRMRLASLWKQPDGALYRTGKPVTVAELERHFGTISVDTSSTPAPVLAKSMASALQKFSIRTAAHSTTLTNNTSTAYLAAERMEKEEEENSKCSSIRLVYPDVNDECAVLVVGGATTSLVTEPVLTMLLHTTTTTTTSAASHQTATNSSVSMPTGSCRNSICSDADLAEVTDYILHQWKPNLQQQGRVLDHTSAASTAAAASADDNTNAVDRRSDDAVDVGPKHDATTVNAPPPLPPSKQTSSTTTITSMENNSNHKAVSSRSSNSNANHKRTHGFSRITSKKAKTGKLKYAPG